MKAGMRVAFLIFVLLLSFQLVTNHQGVTSIVKVFGDFLLKGFVILGGRKVKELSL